ncbi:MAG: gamma-glutamyl-gamma-aminobutyrate hydrolase family protein [Synergistaceae bacterium]|nr:gamma-glutamyl-gamma-aminobutyrate hydrolase family protein [Synergistaceae bacterium]
MKSKPLIGILASNLSPKAELNASYVRAISQNGGAPVILPDCESLPVCNALVFPGGIDVDPALYNEEPHKELGRIDRALDDFWIESARYAVSRKIPVLGICRGLQLLNVFLGGTLYQDIESEIKIKSERQGSINHRQITARHLTSHSVDIDEGTRLYRLIGAKSISVNSMHHQAIKSLAEGLKVSSLSPEDGIIEGIESPDGLIVAVQWHPEELLESVPVMNKLFADLIQRAGQ